MTCKPYDITLQEFLNFFPVFTGIDNGQYCTAYKQASIYVSTDCEYIGLPKNLHILAIKLATAHCLMKNNAVASIVEANGGDTDGSLANIKHATEGFVSVSRAVYEPKNALESELLADDPYGVMLLNILNQAQPPTLEPDRCIFPYYPSLGYGFVNYPFCETQKKDEDNECR